MKISKNILRKIIREEVRTLMEAKSGAKFTKDELKVIKGSNMKLEGKPMKFKIKDLSNGTGQEARYDRKGGKDEYPVWANIEKGTFKGKSYYTGWISVHMTGSGMGWDGTEIKSSKDFPAEPDGSEQNLKQLALMFKKLKTIIKRNFGS